MSKLRAKGETGKYDHLTVQQLKELLAVKEIRGRSKLKTRFQMIQALEK